MSIIGAEEVIVLSLKEVYNLLRRGAEKRRTATTLMNMTSRFSLSFDSYLVIYFVNL